MTGWPALSTIRLAHISANFGVAVTYQPSSHYWPLQWYELAIFAVAAVLLVGFCFWWLRRPHHA